MQSTSTAADAGKLLVSALRNTNTGFVARIKVTSAHRANAFELASCRRTFAKLSRQRGYRDHERARQAPSEAWERGRLCADRRGVLAELLTDDLMALAGVEYGMQPYVSNKPEGGMDLRFNGLQYDVKAAGQLSPEWSAGPNQAGRMSDDRFVTINYVDHLNYLLELGAAGYVCFYFYVEGGVPVAADVFVYTLEQVGAHEVHGASEHHANTGKDMRHFRVPPHFPDARRYDGHALRLDVMAAAGFIKSPFAPVAQAA